MSSPLDLARRYFEAWNARDAEAIVATFAPSGTYCDPTTGEVPAQRLRETTAALWQAFSDLRFEIVTAGESAPGIVAAEWIMRGTHTGAFMHLPPSGNSVELAGVDLIRVAADGIESVNGYFDPGALASQLGLQSIVQPRELGSFRFGTSVSSHSGSKAIPGAISVTAIWSTEADIAEIQTRARETIKDLHAVEGYIGTVTARIGSMGVTLTAWESPEHTRQIMTAGPHRDAMKRFWENLGYSAFTSVWTPARINPFWVRCPTCRHMNDSAVAGGTCRCGAPLPERPGCLDSAG